MTRTANVGTEVLDEPSCPPELVRATLTDIARSNTLFGGRAAAWFGVRRLMEQSGKSRLTVVDVGAGAGDIARYLEARSGRIAQVIALDRHPAAARLCKDHGFCAVVADGWRLPLADRSVDIVVVSQVLHHFNREAGVAFLSALSRVARLGVVIADLRRARAAAAGIWFASIALGFHPITRRDGVTSVRRGFSATELTGMMSAAGMPGTVLRRPGFRLVGIWSAPANG